VRAVRHASVAVPAASRDAVLTKAALRSAALLGLNGAALARVIGMSEATVSRLANGGRLLESGTKPAELAALLIRAYRSLDAVVGNSEEHRRAWMTSFNKGLNAVPKEAILTAEGLVRVVTYLDAARAPL
jgi:transcriptional regulator with XRE-family HTH domain